MSTRFKKTVSPAMHYPMFRSLYYAPFVHVNKQFQKKKLVIYFCLFWYKESTYPFHVRKRIWE